MQVQKKVFVVTGGGDGIGRELVVGLLSRGASVAAVDINQAGLQKTIERAARLITQQMKSLLPE
jgi:NAD(P)-dependent dehydrogenase (short-subunit alcohol dehydrogenase family)